MSGGEGSNAAWRTFESHLNRVFESNTYDEIDAVRTRLKDVLDSGVFDSEWAQMISDALFVIALGHRRCIGPDATQKGSERLGRCLNSLIASRPCSLCFSEPAESVPSSDEDPMPGLRYARGERPKVLTIADADAPSREGTQWTKEQMRKLFIDLERWVTERRFETMESTFFRSNVKPALKWAIYNPSPYADQHKYWFVTSLGTFPDQAKVLRWAGKTEWHASGFGSSYWFSAFWGFLSNEKSLVKTEAGVVSARSLLPVACVTNGYATADLKLLNNGIDGFAYGRKLVMAIRLLYEYMEFHVLAKIRRLGGGWADILDDAEFVEYLRNVPEPQEPPKQHKSKKRAREEGK